ncbi:MAG: zinc ribbon domain-containing protein [Verrucomicrobiia bacterium]
MPPEVCPNCGAAVPPEAKACPECGSDEETGWAATAYASHLGLPDERFDHDEFIKQEFGPEPAKPPGIAWFWWVVALLVVAGMLFFLLPR